MYSIIGATESVSRIALTDMSDCMDRACTAQCASCGDEKLSASDDTAQNFLAEFSEHGNCKFQGNAMTRQRRDCDVIRAVNAVGDSYFLIEAFIILDPTKRQLLMNDEQNQMSAIVRLVSEIVLMSRRLPHRTIQPA